LYKESLRRDPEEIKKAFGNTVRFSVNREIKDIDELERDESKIITSGTVYGEETQAAAYTPFKETIFKQIVERVPAKQDQLIEIVTRVAA
jgi:hypothetical protein